MNATEVQDCTLDIAQSVEIDADMETAFASLVRRLTERSATADNTPMPMKLELWPGGRWYRDLGDGQGHLWGFVQVIKPPQLIEIHGPMFMSYAVTGHVQFRLTETEDGCHLALRHRVLGIVPQDHREGLGRGWRRLLDDVKVLSQ